MKILVVSFNDSDNLTIENVLYELEARGHEITIFAPFMDDDSIRMFKGLKAKICPIKELTNKRAKEFDVAFCSVMMMGRMKFLDIYCFVYSQFYEEYFMTDGADFMFTYRSGCLPRCSYRCASMQVGDPKNDKVVFSPTENSKRILYVDSGHMPFGRKGKEQIAEMLLEICEKFPDYELCIKPRWLRGKKDNFTHKNTNHIYDVIEECCGGNVPSNLNMLNKHLNLQELIDSSISVITLYSGATLNAMLQEKGLLIAAGWENEDKWDIRNEGLIKGKHDLYSESGCVVNYKELVNYLPDGIRAEKAFEDKMFCYKRGASKRIAEVMEYVFEQFLKKGLYPDTQEYSYETYTDTMSANAEITMKTLKQERVRDILQQNVALLSYRVHPAVDFSRYYKELDLRYKTAPITEEGFRVLAKEMAGIRDDILVEHSELLMQDDIDQAFLLRAMFDSGRESDILSIPSEDVLCIGPYHYYLGLIYSKYRETDLAINHFIAFLTEANERSYEKYPQEANWGLKRAYDYVFQHYDGSNISDETMADLCLNLFGKGIEYKTDYKFRDRVFKYIPGIAERLWESDFELAAQCFRLYASHTAHYSLRPLEKKVKALEKENKRIKRSFVYRIRAGVERVIRKVRRGFDCLEENGWAYTWRHGSNKVKAFMSRKVGQTAPIHIWRIFRQKVFGGYRIYEELIHQYGENAQIFLSAPSAGDGYLLGRCFKAYTEKHYSGHTNVFCVFGKQTIDVAKFFSIPHIEALSMDEFKMMFNLFMFMKPGILHLDAMHHHVFYRHTAFLAYLEGLHGFNLSSIGLAYLDVDESEVEHPVFTSDEHSIEGMFLGKLLTPGKTVLLSPYAKSVRSIPLGFWEKLAYRLKKEGFTVCTNSSGAQEPAIPGTSDILIPYGDAVSFLEKAGVYIGLRSGLSDVLSSADATKIVLHSKDNFKRSLVCGINDSYSMCDMYHQPNQYDLIWSAAEEDELIAKIITLTMTKGCLQDENSCICTN